MKQVAFVMAFFSLIAVIGCGQNSGPQIGSTEPDNFVSEIDGTKYLLSEEPAGAQDVIAVHENAADGDDVLLAGRIGGSPNPWVARRAVFTIVDESLKACSDIPGDKCETPWDYCCATDKLPTSTALVKFIDENGEPLRADARELLHVTELSHVIVKGKAHRDDDGNLTVLATGLFVKN